jgi:DNA polymerase II small subunit/DNA polymerase delta subunit B
MISPQQRRFIEFYSLTGNATQSAIEAGYSKKTARQKGHELKTLYRSEIVQATQKLLADKVPAGLRWLSDLAESAESESVRLGAIRDLLDRAGLKPVEKVETTTIERMSTEEIERELDALLKH